MQFLCILSWICNFLHGIPFLLERKLTDKLHFVSFGCLTDIFSKIKWAWQHLLAIIKLKLSSKTSNFCKPVPTTVNLIASQDFSDENGGDVNKYDFFYLVYRNVSTPKRSAMFSKQPMHDATKSGISKRSLQSTK